MSPNGVSSKMQFTKSGSPTEAETKASPSSQERDKDTGKQEERVQSSSFTFKSHPSSNTVSSKTSPMRGRPSQLDTQIVTPRLVGTAATGRRSLRTIYSPTSNQTYIRIKPNESVIGILER